MASPLRRIFFAIRNLGKKHIIPANYPKLGLAFWLVSWVWAFRNASGPLLDFFLLAPAAYFPYLTYLYFLSVNRRLALLLALSRAAAILFFLAFLYLYLF